MAAVIPAVTRISSRIIRVLGCNPGPMTLQGTNTYIVGTGKRRVLIDTGDADVPQYIHYLKTVLDEEEIHLDHILVSHWHHDHLDGVSDIFSQVSERTGSLYSNFSYYLLLYTVYLSVSISLGICKVWKFPSQKVQATNVPDNLPLHSLEDKQVFEIEGATLQVLLAPGHTDDHAIFHLQEEDAIFSGDCILGEGTAVFEDLYDYMNSLNLILGLDPKIIYPGHGNIIKSPQEKIQFYIQHRLEREKQIMEVLNQNPKKQFTEETLVEEIYTDLSPKLIAAACRNVNHHLMKLLKEESVKLVDKKWQIKC
ncbi:unnamed protein product [Acanthoscelides obtectus]|uniref:Metallo-beta-lactamase domain-containing protein n=1 Tax=Acanthoscelides obtectus TaxID=200917 RepID=A0A9P0KGE8_ACAOB|nr:unnamed protein product [Acanthoscelides obtectus]CAK1660896.1 Beta-lactamase-like protein 2 homolog [Acanthoscelides obtectus]